MDRVILHCDLNNFFASVECKKRPELWQIPMIVGGNIEARHGIVLAKNELAKKTGIKTGMVIWQAKMLCPNLVSVPPNMSEYIAVSDRVRALYYDYSDQVESFGIDECWLDVTGSVGLFGDGASIARKIREAVKKQEGITVSIGVSYNKIFAKLGSDYKKPDAVTVLTRENYRDIVWPLPVEDLLFVGRATKQKLNGMGIYTIGDLAQVPVQVLEQRFGKMGCVLWTYANGYDQAPVRRSTDSVPAKSIGNSTTTPRDLVDNDDVYQALFALSDTVATRMREQNLRGQVVEIWVRDNKLLSFVRQIKLAYPTCLTKTIAREAYTLFLDNYKWENPIRSVGVRVSMLTSRSSPRQSDFFIDEVRLACFEDLAFSVDRMREKYGYQAVLTGREIIDRSLPVLSPRECRELGAGMYNMTPQR